MSVYSDLGVKTVINAKGPATRLSGGIMRPEVSAAMAEASQSCVDIAELQAAASSVISDLTGAEAGYVASGASACLLIGAAATMTGLDPGKMARLPDSTGMKNECVMVRSQRNFYDHAIRAAGMRIIEVGLPDRYSGAGVRDAEGWEIDDAITERTAAVFYVADPQARPRLSEVVAVAHARGVPVIVDAAAQLPPQDNLKRFIAEGVDLVAFSGGKAIGGPQASGILAGKRDLVMSAALQHLDLDIYQDMWQPPSSLIDKTRLKGTPLHGIGRTCKAGKEEIVGLLTALRLFTAEGDQSRHARWLADCRNVATALKGRHVTVTGGNDIASVPTVEITLDTGPEDVAAFCIRLQNNPPGIALDPAQRDRGIVTMNPMCLKPGEAEIVGREIARALK
ncbi:aminotransferase class V-fold PLP-dependent enzyme [Aestuariivirga sp.]|jgi:L-seryl-tRNA(Ser) seleniumtransferase|uniref:aminotransferase class V-fold PLP-dependent enzyme n=1 Tax=Aestuariivirga sp. TaxID=2650926 RepID=UPI0037850A24